MKSSQVWRYSLDIIKSDAIINLSQALGGANYPAAPGSNSDGPNHVSFFDLCGLFDAIFVNEL